MSSASEIYRFDELTWSDVNEAVAIGKIPIIPTGSVEQHGPHLPLKVDHVCANTIATEAAKQRSDIGLVMPPVSYGYVHHVMDFPGSINIHFEHFIQYVLDICKSLAYHGFKKMVIVNGHGSNEPLVNLISRRVWLETDASCAFCNWWQLLRVDPEFESTWRESIFPGGCAHAGELETSMMLYIDRDSVREDLIDSNVRPSNKYTWVDLFESGPIGMIGWTSQGSDSGTFGEADKGTVEKGEKAVTEASRQLADFLAHYQALEIPPRQTHQDPPPTIDLSFPTD